jgi:hypothetical protein
MVLKIKGNAMFSFARNCWAHIAVNASSWLKPERATRHIKRILRVPFAMEIIILMCWCIWSQRNAWLFQNEDPQVLKCKDHFKRESGLVIHRSKRSRLDEMQSWLCNLA